MIVKRSEGFTGKASGSQLVIEEKRSLLQKKKMGLWAPARRNQTEIPIKGTEAGAEGLSVFFSHLLYHS